MHTRTLQVCSFADFCERFQLDGTSLLAELQVDTHGADWTLVAASRILAIVDWTDQNGNPIQRVAGRCSCGAVQYDLEQLQVALPD